MKHLAAIAAVFALAISPMAAQQIELNDAGGSLTNAGTNPVPGSPITLNLISTFSPRVTGTVPNSGFIFAGGLLATTSTQFALLNNQWWDLDIPSSTIIGDGIGGTGAVPFLFVLNPVGQANLTFSSNASLNGLTYAFQAITVDPAQAPFGLNITAALAYTWTNPPLNFTGDDTVQTYVFPSGPYTMYGVNYGALAVSTNGWVKFGTTTQTDLSESVPEFLNGTPGGVAPASPIIAVDWEDLDMANTPNPGNVTCSEIAPGITEVRWINGQFFSTSAIWGTIVLTINNNAGFPIITMDYTAYAPAPAPSEGLVGISDGNLGGALGPDVGADIVTGGVVNTYGPTGNNYLSYFQNFDGTGGFGNPAVTPIDVGGTVINWIDASGFGDWAIF